MPGRMGEVPSQLPLAKHTTRGSIHFAASHARTNRGNGSLLRFQHGLIQPSSVFRRPSDMHGARSIRTIIGEYNTKITDHEPAPRNEGTRRSSMHYRRPRSRREDGRKGHGFGTRTTSFVFHGSGDFHFPHARPNFLACDMEKTGAKFNRPAYAQDLGSVLHHARTLDQRRRRMQPRLPFQHGGQPVTHAGRDRLRFNAQGWGRTPSLPGQPLRRRHQRWLAGDDDAHIVDACALYFLFCLGAVASVSKKDGTTSRDHQSGRAACKTTQIVDIRKMRHQQRVEIVLFEPNSKTTQAARVIHKQECSKNQFSVLSCQLSVVSLGLWRPSFPGNLPDLEKEQKRTTKKNGED